MFVKLNKKAAHKRHLFFSYTYTYIHILKNQSKFFTIFIMFKWFYIRFIFKYNILWL